MPRPSNCTSFSKHAELTYAVTPEQTFELLRDGKANAMASARPTLLSYAAKLPGSHVLEDRYGANINRIVVPKGKAALAFLRRRVRRGRQSQGRGAEGHRARRPARRHRVAAGRSEIDAF